MKNLIYIFTFLISMAPSVNASVAEDLETNRFDGSRFIFVEGGIEFSVYPDGEFDFVLPQVVQGLNININNGPVNLSYNAGYNYDAYVQYDNYGAVIQIENVPIYYDNYGRIAQAGDIMIHYQQNQLVGIGGLQVFYRGNAFDYTRGYVNVYNRNINYYPYQNYFYRPYYDRCLVYSSPYRRYYQPERFSYNYHKQHYINGYRDGYSNAYRDFNRPDGRVAHNNAREGSYKDARIATSRNSATRSDSRAYTQSRSSRTYNSVQRTAPTNNSNQSVRSSGVSTQRSSTSSQAVPTRQSASRISSGTARSVISQPNRSSSVAPTQRSQNNTARVGIQQQRTKTQPAVQNRSRVTTNNVSSNTNSRSQNARAATTNSRSSSTGTSRSSRGNQ